MKFLHCADVHLGGANAQERMQVFEEMLNYCQQCGVQLLLLAGDLFEEARAEEPVRRRAFAAMERHQELSILIAAGNHDPNCAGGNYDGKLPGNVYVFGEKWSCVSIAELNVRVWGASFAQAAAPHFTLPERKMPREEGILELGVLHGDVGSENAKSDYRSISQESIAKTGVDYLALGHVHKRSRILRAGQTSYAYAGCLQGAGFDETGKKGAYLGAWEEDGLKISFVPLGGSVWREEMLEVTGLNGTLEIAQEAQRRLGQGQDHVRLVLTGECTEPVDAQALERLLKENAGSIRVLDETQCMDMATLAKEDTLRGAFVRRMMERIAGKEAAGEDAAAEKLALQYGLSALEGEVRTHADRADPDR